METTIGHGARYRQHYQPGPSDVLLSDRHWALDWGPTADLLCDFLRNQQPALKVPHLFRRGRFDAELNRIAYQIPLPAQRPNKLSDQVRLMGVVTLLHCVLIFSHSCIDLQTWPWLQILGDLS